LAQLRQNERLLASGEGDNNGRRHSGNNSEFGKVALADIAELTPLCQSLVVWFSYAVALTDAFQITNYAADEFRDPRL
jgi:hypothetical protein